MTDAIGFLTQSLPLVGGRKDLAASILFWIPLVRESLLALGCVDASSSNCHKLLENSVSLQLFAGGEQEQVRTNVNQPLIYARHRRGFIRLALEYGARILPIYVFGEDQLYSTSSLFLSTRIWIVKKLRIALPIAWGRWWNWLIPHRRELVMVMAEPIKPVREGEEEKIVKKVGDKRERRTDVTEEEVEETLKKYIAAMEALYEKHHKQMKGYEDKKLLVL